MKLKKAIVTGGSRGIGLAIIKKLLKDNYEIWYISRTQIQEELSNTHFVCCDIADHEKLESSLKEIVKEAGSIDLLINNAGITKDNLIMRMKQEAWDDVININLTSAFITSKVLSRTFLKQRKGSIINISSVVGVAGNAGQANYSASKAGLIGLTKTLAKEFASRNVRVNCIAPGFIETSMSGKLNDEQKAQIVENIPLNRMGQVEDVANLVSFLASDNSNYITGQVICVDGGMVI
ncbi:MAG: 3-oxoacyl-[acyl-carrier-protein] reductase [Pleomorphochaeta sp.]